MTPEEKKEKKKKYYNENKEKIKEYYLENKEKNKKKNRLYYLENKEKSRLYYLENKEKIQAYSQTEAGKKSQRITNWKKSGVIHDDFPSLYDYYINCKNCEECNVELNEFGNGNHRCLDHDHTTGLFRNVLCHTCNLRRR